MVCALSVYFSWVAYRDIWFQGGIPETSFAPGWLKGIQNGRNETEDVLRMREEHPLLDELWKIREVDLSAIDVPAFIVADWGNDLHTRGTLEAYKRISSKDKWLEVHGRKKWVCPPNSFSNLGIFL